MPEVQAEPPLTEAEAIALAYHRAAGGDAWTALVRAIADALADLDAAAEARARHDRWISQGYVRGQVETGARTLSAAGTTLPTRDRGLRRTLAPGNPGV